MSATETTKNPVLVFTDGNEIQTLGVKGGQNIAQGDFVNTDVNGFVQKATSTNADQAKGVGVAFESIDNTAGTDGALSIQIIVGNTYVMGIAGGALNPLQLLKLDATGKLVANAKPAAANATYLASDTDATTNYFGNTVGRYFGHAKEEKLLTSAVLNDAIIVRLGL